VVDLKAKDSSFLKKRSKKRLFIGPDGSTRRAQKDKVFLLLFLQKKKNPSLP
jgi:hypothetical protein